MGKNNTVASRTIEWLRFFCVTAVVFVHSRGAPLDGNDIIAWRFGVYDIIRIMISEGFCRVAVPIFFFISGYLFYLNLEDWDGIIWRNKLKKRFTSLFIPYLLWNIIALVFDAAIHSSVLFKSEEIFLQWFKDQGGGLFIWDTGNGFPINTPLWFIRDLIVFVVVSPIIYEYVKKTRLFGLVSLYVLYFLFGGHRIPGFSAEGLFYFSCGAYYSLNRIDFTSLFRKYWIVSLCFAFPLLISIIFTYGYDEIIYGYERRLFTLFGSFSVIGIASILMKKNWIKVHPLLTKSSFFIFAAHGTIVLPLVLHFFSILFPENQMSLICMYFSAPILVIIILVLLYDLFSCWMPRTMGVLTGGRT